MPNRRRTSYMLLCIFNIILVTVLSMLALWICGTSFFVPVLIVWLCLVCFFSWKYSRIWHRPGHYHQGDWTVEDIDEVSGAEFECLVCDILAANGFDIAENTQLTGDFGVDVLARRDGITYAIQCKRYHSPVGVDAVQQVYAGRAYYECHVAMVLSNQTFTSGAKRLADKLGVVLWDRDRLEEML